MEDLGALVSFLRVPVLKNPPTFHKFIASPATSSSKDRFKNLRILLESICLRRTREILPLKLPISHVREVFLTPSERQVYKDLVQEGTKQIDMIVSRRSKKKMNAVRIRVILSLRLFCNNGNSDANLQMESTGLPSDPDEALAYLQQDDQDNCAICSTTIYSIDDSDKTDGGSFIGSCCHLVCHTCKGQHRKLRSHCPACENKSEPEVLGPPVSQAGQINPRIQQEGGAARSVGEYPSKLLLLLEDIGHAGTDKW